jgi:histidyl-tRNA synthetase
LTSLFDDALNERGMYNLDRDEIINKKHLDKNGKKIKQKNLTEDEKAELEKEKLDLLDERQKLYDDFVENMVNIPKSVTGISKLKKDDLYRIYNQFYGNFEKDDITKRLSFNTRRF